MKLEKELDETRTVSMEVYSTKLDDATRILGGILKGVDRSVIKDISIPYVKKTENTFDIHILISYFELDKYFIQYFLKVIELTSLSTLDYQKLYEGLETRDKKMILLALIPYLRAIRSFLKGGNKGVTIEGKSIDRDKIPKELRDVLIEKDEDAWYQFGE